MCLPAAALLTVASGAMQYMGQRQEAKAQAAQYNAQAAADEQNAKIQARQNEQVADRYASEQQKLADRHQLFRGAAAAEAGGSGLSGMSGSVLDVMGAGKEAYNQDSLTLLGNQRNDIYGGQLQEHTFLQSASANRAAAYNVRKQAQVAGIGTILGTAASAWGVSKDWAGASKGKQR